MTSAQVFAELLTEALWQIKRRERRSVASIQDELGYALGREHGGSVIEYWRKGHRPASIQELEALCQELHRRLRSPQAWFERLLVAGAHPYPQAFLTTLFPGQAQRPAALRIRPPLHDFSGRTAERRWLAGILTSQAHTAPLVVLRGMGGIGKTELAYAAISDASASYPDGAVFVPVQATSGAGASACDALRLILQLGDPAQAPSTAADLAALQAQYQALLAQKRMVIVLDDVESVELIGALLPPPGSALLVTTRRRISVPGMHALDMDLLAPDDAARLLTEICPRIGAHAALLARHCAYLPLALRISASVLANDDTYPVELYGAQLAEERLRLELLRDPDNPNLDVAASLALSIERLAPEAQEALRCLGVLRAWFSEERAGQVIGVDEPQAVRRIIGQLRRQHLLNYDEQTQQYHLHDLVRVLVWQQVAEPAAVWLRYARAVVARAVAINAMEGPTAVMLSHFDQELAHIRAVWAWLAAQAPEPEIDALVLELVRGTTKAGMMRFDMASEQIPLLQHGIAAAQRCGRLLDEGACHLNLGLISSTMARYDQALASLQAVAAIAAATENLQLRVYAAQVLGYIHRAQGNLAAARACLQEAIDAPYDDDHLKGSCLSLLGETLRRQGHLPEALAVLRRTQALLQELGDQHRGIAVGVGLSATEADLGNLDAAQAILDATLVTARMLQDNEATAYVLRACADLALHQDDAEQAHEYIDSALATMTESEVDILHAIQGLRAAALYRQGARAAGLAEFAALERAIASGGDAWTLATTARRLGHYLIRDGDLAGGLACLDHWISYQRKVEHRDLAADEALFGRLQAQHQARP